MNRVCRWCLSFLLVPFLVTCTTGETTIQPNASLETESEMPPEIVFQSGDLIIGRQVYNSCPPPQGGWLWARMPVGDPVTVDLVYGNTGPDIPFPRWTQRDVDAVVAAGGTVVSYFDTAILRATIPRDSVELVKPASARFVARTDRRDVRVTVGSITPDVQELFVELGGVITLLSYNVGAIHGVMPDSAAHLLKEHPAVGWLYLTIDEGCLAG